MKQGALCSAKGSKWGLDSPSRGMWSGVQLAACNWLVTVENEGGKTCIGPFSPKPFWQRCSSFNPKKQLCRRPNLGCIIVVKPFLQHFFFFIPDLDLWHWVNCTSGSKKPWACGIAGRGRTEQPVIERRWFVLFTSMCWQLQRQCKQCQPLSIFCHKDHPSHPPLLSGKVSVLS